MVLQWSIAKRFKYCIIVLHCNILSSNLSELTGPRGAGYIDIKVIADRRGDNSPTSGQSHNDVLHIIRLFDTTINILAYLKW